MVGPSRTILGHAGQAPADGQAARTVHAGLEPVARACAGICVSSGLEADRKLGDNGIYFVGDEGVILCGGWSGTPRLVPESAMRTFVPPEKTIPRSPGHRAEWVQACLAGRPEAAKAGFWYSAPFTEALLVGVLPIRLGRRIEWDATAMKAKNMPEADVLIRKPYRAGFKLPT